MNPKTKYRRFPKIELADRKWPSQEITKAPIWCSVDLRDGNQALEVPMTVSQKTEMFNLLVECGFKEIEVGFPSASSTDFEFVRHLIEKNLIPDDVTIQVLVQAREDLIKQTIESLIGVRKVIIHLYNSTSPAQRKIVFGLEKEEIIQMAIKGTELIKKYSQILIETGTDVLLQYSPESFSATEVEFSLQICEAVIQTWGPTPRNKMIVNLPCTVEVSMPNIYADQIEWFCRNISCRESVIISVHTHNDRGTGVAATELGILAGADRVEGTLFGNGERTGNLDIIIVALNLYTQGIDPMLNFSDIESMKLVYGRCTNMTVPPRHPYSGELVFTAFSGSHQDAIRKGLKFESDVWEVPYLVIDPTDIGRTYEEVIRVNGQSGKGGIAYLLENECNIHLPKGLIREFGVIAGKVIDGLGREVTSKDLKEILWREYIDISGLYKLKDFRSKNNSGGCECEAVVEYGDQEINVDGNGNGPIDAFVHAFNKVSETKITIIYQSEHALDEGSESSAIAYVEIEFPTNKSSWGIGVHTDIQVASIRAIMSALCRNS